jgi:hypothetical protein
MPTLWTFGDSFTEQYNSKYPWSEKYIKWKGHTPIVYGQLLSQELNFNLRNLGIGGYDNYSIFESFIKIIDEIKPDDVLVFGWSHTVRFRLVNQHGVWSPILPAYKNNFNNVSDNTINEVLINRTNSLYENELNNFIKIINFSLKKNIIIHWTPFTKTTIAKHIGNLETIKQETNGEIDDGHYSENGQKELSNILKVLYYRKKNNELI